MRSRRSPPTVLAQCLATALLGSAALLLPTCGGIEETSSPPPSSLTGAYEAAFEYYINADAGWENLTFIAIDESNLPYLSDQEKQDLLAYFEKYGVRTMDASLATLRQQGLADQMSNIPNGLLLSVQSVRILSATSVKIEGGMFRSPFGAFGATCTVVYRGGSWTITAVENAQIS